MVELPSNDGLFSSSGLDMPVLYPLIRGESTCVEANESSLYTELTDSAPAMRPGGRSEAKGPVGNRQGAFGGGYLGGTDKETCVEGVGRCRGRETLVG